MADLHIFGDSYSVDWEQVKLKAPWANQAKYAESFDRDITHFQDLLKKQFKLNKIHNYAVGGFDNYSILETIGKFIHKIKKDDYVCIGWSDISRYRIIYNDKKSWVRLLAGNHTIPTKYKKEVHKEFLYQCVDRDCNLTLKEVTLWQNILKNALPTNTIYWSPFFVKGKYDNAYPTPNFKFTTITDVSSINDAHASEEGMIQIGEWLVELFKDNPFNNRKSDYYVGSKLI